MVLLTVVARKRRTPINKIELLILLDTETTAMITITFATTAGTVMMLNVFVVAPQLHLPSPSPAPPLHHEHHHH